MPTLDELKWEFLEDPDLLPDNLPILDQLSPFLNPHVNYDEPQPPPNDLDLRLTSAFRWRRYWGYTFLTEPRVRPWLVPVSTNLKAVFGPAINERVSDRRQRALSRWLDRLLPPNVTTELRNIIRLVVLSRMAGLPQDLRPLLNFWSDSHNRTPLLGFDELGRVNVLHHPLY